MRCVAWDQEKSKNLYKEEIGNYNQNSVCGLFKKEGVIVRSVVVRCSHNNKRKG
jgi:hypothetical protein